MLEQAEIRLKILCKDLAPDPKCWRSRAIARFPWSTLQPAQFAEIISPASPSAYGDLFLPKVASYVP